MSGRILFVDDEPNVLQAFERLLRKQFECETAVGPELGMQAIEQRGPFAVVVADLRMPGMNGNQFLTAVRKITPDTVRIMLTGQADLRATIDAVNQGNVFRFLLKPCPQPVITGTLQAALRQYQLVMAERELLEKTLNGAIHVLTEILGLVNPVAFSRAHRIRKYVSHMASFLGLEQTWQFEIAAMLSQIGCIAVPPEVLSKVAAKKALSPAEEEIVAAHPNIARRLLENIPRLELISEMIGRQPVLEPSQVLPPVSSPASQVLVGSEMLYVANSFDELTSSGLLSRSDAIQHIRRNCHLHEDRLLAALESVPIEREALGARMVVLDELEADMVIDQDVHAKNGMLLLAKGHQVTFTVLARLKSFAQTVGIIEPFSVLAPVGPAIRPRVNG